MDYEKKYKEALANMQELYNSMKYMSSTDALHTTTTLEKAFPELKEESKDEKIRKAILTGLIDCRDAPDLGWSDFGGIPIDDCIAWLEKQKVTDEEIIFRPVVGTDIRIAAKQALEKIGVGKKVVLAFNGAYIPVNGKTVGEIDSEYDAWLKKQSDTNKTINRNEFAQGVLRGAAINLITWIDYNTAKGNMCLSNMECKVIEDALVSGDWDKIYAYIKRKLEKQGEQNPVDFKAKDWYVSKVDGKIHNMTYNPTDKVEPKFKIEKDKWYVCIKDLLDNYANTAFHKGDTYLSTQDGSLMPSNSNVPFEVACPDTYFRDWTIQDAKDGDVLADEYNNIGLYRGKKGEFWESYIYLGCDNYLYGFDIGGYHEHKNTKPATKEQRDLLFSKIKEAGYEWDAGKKELKKIEQIPMMEMITPEESLGIDSDTYNKIVDECIYGEQKLTWSEKDEENLNQLHKLIVEKAYRECEIDDETLYGKWFKLDNWLKSLKGRIQPQWKPSEEQIKDFGGALLILKLQHYAPSESLESLYEQLKKL